MKTIGFVGACDKTDLILNVAKILHMAKNKILIVDGTTLQQMRYIVPVIKPTMSYLTTFENIDVAVGFDSLEDIKKYFGANDLETFGYDIMIVDCDRLETYEGYNLKTAGKFFVTNFGPYSVRRGLELLKSVKEPVDAKKILFSRYMTEEEDQYLTFISANTNITWHQDKIYFPTEEGDIHINLENQMSERIKFKELSESYKEGVLRLCMSILGKQTFDSEIKRIMRELERG